MSEFDRNEEETSELEDSQLNTVGGGAEAPPPIEDGSDPGGNPEDPHDPTEEPPPLDDGSH